MNASQAGIRRRSARVAPMLPLALLESIRSHDRPPEVLEDEDLSTSLPRRLGLTDVVGSRIRDYEDADRDGWAIPAEEVADLLRLVLRRPDAEMILCDAGALVARWFHRRTRGIVPVRLLPGPLRRRRAARAARRMLRRIAGGGRVTVVRRPLRLQITGALTAELDANGYACTVYTGALEELYSFYSRKRPTVRHSCCATQGQSCCEWMLPA